jgi:hypothetical protein
MRERLGEEWWWAPNLVVRGLGGVLISLLECMGWGYGRILDGVGGSSQVIPNLRWGMDPMLDFSMICGVKARSLMKFL